MSDEPFPGWVEVSFTDADGRSWSVFDKPPVFDCSGELTPDAPYPIAVALDCVVLSVDADLVTISTLTPWGVSTEDGRSEFTVFGRQLVVGSRGE